MFDDLVQDDGTILKEKNDYGKRAGQTFKPITTYDAKSTQVLHALLQTFDHFMKVCVRVRARVFDWAESPLSRTKLFLKNAKKELQDNILAATGIEWDKPDPTGKGGNTTTGNNACRLLHEKKNRDVILDPITDDYKERLAKFGAYLSVIIRVLCSKWHVKVDKYHTFCKEFHLFILDNFPRELNQHLKETWISVTPSLHKFLCHSWELIEANDEHGLGNLDESGIEGNNKILRNIRTRLSRKMSQKSNLVDTLSRMWVCSDPQVNAVQEKTKPFCNNCQERGHSTRYCGVKRKSVLSYEDTLFNSLVYI